jgi:hypothetical protein
MQPVQRRMRIDRTPRSRFANTEHRGYAGSRPRQHPPHTLRGAAAQWRREKLAHDTERRLALKLTAAGDKHLKVACPSALRSGPNQRTLPDPGRPMKHNRAPIPHVGVGQQRIDPGQLPLALE